MWNFDAAATVPPRSFGAASRQSGHLSERSSALPRQRCGPPGIHGPLTEIGVIPKGRSGVVYAEAARRQVNRMEGALDEQWVAGMAYEAAASNTRTLAQQMFASSYVGLVRLAAATLRDRTWAEDVVQETFSRVQSKLNGLRDPDNALAYLRKSVLNRARSELRRHRVRQATDLDDRSRQVDFDAEDEAMARLRRSELLATIARLPGRQRDVVVLRFVQQLSLDETASTLRISIGAVKASQHRALTSLKKRLEGRI